MSGDLGSTIQAAWNAILDVVSKIVSPDWGALVAVLPFLLAPLVVLYLLVGAGAWTVFGLRRPRANVRYVDGALPLARDEAGAPIPPAGLPFSLRTGLSYPPGTVRTDEGEELAVICPMCRVERAAELPACGNCGLVLRIEWGARVARPAGPPPGGAAIA